MIFISTCGCIKEVQHVYGLFRKCSKQIHIVICDREFNIIWAPNETVDFNEELNCISIYRFLNFVNLKLALKISEKLQRNNQNVKLNARAPF